MARFPLRGIGLKFLSICIATLLWLVVAGDRIVERALRVPVEYQNLPAGLEIVGDPLEAIDARVRGSSGALGRLAPADTSAVIDLRNARPGRRLFHLTASQVKVPYGMEVVQVAPATMPIEFENSAVRILQVRPSIEGRPAPGYAVISFKADPATVEVIGPESSLRGLDEAMTEPVSVANESRSVRESVTIGVADPTVRLRTPQTATVTVEIAPGNATRVVPGVPVVVVNLEPGLRARLLTPAATLAVKGTHDAVQAVGAPALEVFVDAAGLAPGEYALEVKARAPQGLTVESIAPRSVRLRVSKP